MKLISQDLQDGDKLPLRHVFNGMGYEGDNISPHLAWDEVPSGTKSFVVTCYDPDAPTGSGWCADLSLHCITAEFPPISSDEASEKYLRAMTDLLRWEPQR